MYLNAWICLEVFFLIGFCLNFEKVKYLSMVFSVTQLKQGTENTYFTETAYASGNANVL